MVSAQPTFDESATVDSNKENAASARTFRVATVAAAALVIAFGVCVMIGWLSDRLELAQLGIDGAVMVFNTALLFVATASALIALAYNRFTIMHWIGMFVIAVAAVTALQLPTNANYGIDELFFSNAYSEPPYAGARMSINSAICFLLLGLALVVMRSPGRQRWRFFTTALLASAALAIAAVAVFGHLTGLTAAIGWKGTYGMAVPTALCSATCAVLLLAWAARYQAQLGVSVAKWLPLIVGNAVVIGTLGLWHALVFQDSESTQSRVQAQFENLTSDLKYVIDHHEGVLMRMAKRWNAGEGTSEADWRDDGTNYLEALKGFEALAWVNSSLDTKWIETNGNEELAQIVANNGYLRKTIQAARQQRTALAIALTNGSTHQTKVWLCEPLLRRGTDDGCLLAIFDLHRLMAHILRRIPMEGQHLTIRERHLVLFESAPLAKSQRTNLRQSAELTFAKLQWTVTDVPSQQWLAQQRSPLPAVILGAGLLLAILLMASLHLAVLARRNLQLANSSEVRFRAIFNNAPLGISVIDDQGHFVQTNASLQRMLGSTEEQLRGKSFAKITHPNDLVRVWSIHQELISGRSPSYQFELQSLAAGGRTKWLSILCATLLDPNQLPLVIAMVTDVTERNLADKRLAIQFRVTQILSEDATTADALQQVIQQVCELLDWDVGEIWTLDSNADQGLRPLVVWQQPSMESDEFAVASQKFSFVCGQGLPGRVWKTRQVAWIDDVLEDSNFPRAAMARASGLRSAFAIPIQFQEEFYGVIEFFKRDSLQPEQRLLETMTSLGAQLGQYFQRQAAELRLRETLALQQAILDNAGRSMISTSPDGTIQVFNRAAERLLGYTSDEMVGKQTPMMIHRTDEIQRRAKDLSQELGHPIAPDYEVFVARPNLGETEEREWTYVRKDNSHFPALLSVTALRNSHGIITGYLGIANDITEQKRVEEELRQAKHAADDANQAKSDFLANMSHEIRTPMNGVVGMTNLVLATPLSALQKEYLKTIKESGDALLTVINDILDFSKVEAGMLALEEIGFNLPDKVASVIQAVSPRSQDKGVQLTCDLDPAVPVWVKGDADRLRQIIMNLVGNAIKFTEQGAVSLRVTVDEAPSDGSRDFLLHFAVSDSGIGIPLEKQRIIFDAFSQADSSTTRRFGGTGLGLTISSRLVNLMGGRIWVESEIGRGSTFHFTARLGTSGQVVEVASPAPVKARTQNLRVLVAEDNAINRLVAVRILELAGHQVAVAVNGQEALNTLAHATFDVVLMDVQMPVLDGFDATAQIRAHERTTGQHIPIVAMTAHAMKGDCERCLEAGMDGYVAKPIQENELFMAIESVIKVPAQPKDKLPGQQDATRNKNTSELPPEVGSLESDWSFQLELAQIFVEDCPESLAEIREAIASHNGPALMQAARCLKGSAGVFNDEKAAEAALRMERVGRDADWKSAESVSLVLDREMTRLSAKLNDLPGANLPTTTNERAQLDLSAYATRLPLAM